MTERETLLAEIAEKQARIAEIDAEPDYEAWRPALQAFCLTLWGESYKVSDPLDKFDKERIRGLIAALPKAPPMGECQPRWPSYLQVEALARRVEGGVTNRVRLVAYEAAMEMANLLHEQMTGEQP
jgi:hypothetical protein